MSDPVYDPMGRQDDSLWSNALRTTREGKGMTKDLDRWTLTIFDEPEKLNLVCEFPSCGLKGVGEVDGGGRKTIICALHGLDYLPVLERTFGDLRAKFANKKGSEMETLRWEQDNVGYGCAVIGCPTTAVWRLAGCMDMPFFCTAHVWELRDLALPAYVVAPEGDTYTVKFRSSSGDLETFMNTRRLSESDATRIAEILNRGYGE